MQESSTGGEDEEKEKKIRWRRDLEPSSRRFWEEKCGIKHLESTGRKESTEEGSAGGKGSAWEKRVKGCGVKYSGRENPSKLKRILGGKV